MAPSNVSKEVTTQVVKWGFWAVMVLMGTGLVTIANRNVYSKQEVDDRDAAIRVEVRHIQEVQSLHNAAVISKLEDVKADLADIRKDLKEKK